MSNRIKLRVIARAKRNAVEAVSDGSFRVHVNKPPVDGSANKAVIELMSDYLKKPKSKITIVHGETSPNKTIEVAD